MGIFKVCPVMPAHALLRRNKADRSVEHFCTTSLATTGYESKAEEGYGGRRSHQERRLHGVLNLLSAWAGADVDGDALQFDPTVRKFDLYDRHVGADELRLRLIEGYESRDFQRQALLVVCCSNLGTLDGDGAVGRRGNEP